MDGSVSFRTLRTAVCIVFAGAVLSACGGGGTATGIPGVSLNGNSSGGTTGGSGTKTGGSATPTPTATPASGGSNGSPAPTPVPTATSTASGSSGGSNPGALNTLSVTPNGIDATLGSSAQIAILDPNYSGPIAISVQGQTLPADVLDTLLSLQDGVLMGEPGTDDVLDINLANMLLLHLLDANGTVLDICETAKTPAVCSPLALTPNATLNGISSNFSSAVLLPGTLQLLSLANSSGILGATHFTVTVSNNNVTVTGIGNNSFALSVAAHVAIPSTAILTVNDGTSQTTIPLTLL
jgi:hypothetical protein